MIGKRLRHVPNMPPTLGPVHGKVFVVDNEMSAIVTCEMFFVMFGVEFVIAPVKGETELWAVTTKETAEFLKANDLAVTYLPEGCGDCEECKAKRN